MKLPKLTQEDKINILLAIFVAALICANLLGSKVTVIFGITASVGIFAYPLTFLMTDIVEEVYGRRKAQSFVYAGFFSLILVFILVLISLAMPPASFYSNNEGYSKVFQNTLRIIVASLTAFFISQTHDVWMFNRWKKRHKGKHLWWRNDVSTIVSQLIDTTIFIFIAFYMVTPAYTVDKMVAMIIPYWTLKIVFALCDTPFCYLGVKWLRAK